MSSSFLRLASVLAASLPLALVAQDQPGQALAGGMATTSAPFVSGGLFLVDANAHTVAPLGNVPPVLQQIGSLCADPFVRGRWYAGTFGPDGAGTGNVDLVEFRASGGNVTSWRVVNAQPLAEDHVLGLAVVGTDLVFLGRQSLSRVDLATGQRTVIRTTGLDAAVTAMTCDGRYAYLATNVRSVQRIDLNGGEAPQLFHYAQVGFVDLIQAMTVDTAGDLWLAVVDSPFGVATSSLRRLRRTDGQLESYLPLPFVGPRSLAFDHRTGDLVVAGGVGFNNSGVVVVHGGVVQGVPFGGLPNPLPALALDQGQPLHRHGPACAASTGEAWIGAVGLPTLGEAGYAVMLRGSVPSALHVLAFGLHPGPRLDLAPLGAPGCEFRVASAVEFPVVTDGNGDLQVPMPVPDWSVLQGLAFDLQFGVLDPTANAFGIALSQAGVAVLR